MNNEDKIKAFSKHLKQLFSVQTTAVCASHFSSLLCALPEVSICSSCPYAQKDSSPTHQYGVSEARRWGKHYMYYCPMGLLFLAFLHSVQETPESAIIVGPIIMGEVQDITAEIDNPAFREQLTFLPNMSPPSVHSLSELINYAYGGLYSTDSPVSMQNDQSEFLNTLELIRAKQQQPGTKYILQAEAILKKAVRDFDREGAQRLLNELLGKMYLQTSFDLEAVKVCSIELLVVLSRTVNATGADTSPPYSVDYLREINRITTIEDLYNWMSVTLHTFIDTSFRFTSIKHTDAIFKVMEYIRANFDQKLTLEDISKNVYMNKAYLSMLFKQETGLGISEYITHVRIEKSKQLLRETQASIAEIACACCFHDQSYFTKVFQRLVGVSPKKYRSQR